MGPRDSHAQQTPQSDPDPGLRESGQDRLCIIDVEAAIVPGDDVISLGDGRAWGTRWVVGKRGGGWFPGHTLPSSSDTITATHPWPSAFHDLPEFGQRCPESGGTGTMGRGIRFASCSVLSCSPWGALSSFPPPSPAFCIVSPASRPQPEAPGPGGLVPCLSQWQRTGMASLCHMRWR